ncbi:MAG: tRNA (guanosine(46)-N7)-methyltransferase TrmB [Halomonadaceae bacterium]|nr:MAG: tRNA (guanosine(46)-N7)-methyltransferase TrmB [Halomonadaceae bacterium]
MNESGDEDLARVGLRGIRSFVLRGGRMTVGQSKAWDRMWPRYGMSVAQGLIDPEQVFGRQAPLNLEIGFGMGRSLSTMAAAAPEQDFIGIEVHKPGCGALLADIEQLELTNLRIYRADANDVLDLCLPDASLNRLMLFFPDPWPKKKHHKRRIVQSAFAQKVRGKLKPGGLFHMATDWEEYAQQMLEVMNAEAGFENTSPEGGFVPKPPERPDTKFEVRGEKLGHGVWDLVYRRSES